jgi:hypothetical protein
MSGQPSGPQNSRTRAKRRMRDGEKPNGDGGLQRTLRLSAMRYCWCVRTRRFITRRTSASIGSFRAVRVMNRDKAPAFLD